MQSQAPAVPTVFTIAAKPGVRRDGTALDSEHYADAVWVRFQRGRPRKIGGYRLMSDLVSGPVRDVFVDARSTENSAHTFSASGIERLAFDNDGIGGGVNVRTPSGFVSDADYLWQSGAMFNSGGGGGGVIVATATPDALNIADDTAGPLYYGNIAALSAFLPIADGSGNITVSGGCCVLQPFLFVYGSNGLIRNSNPNDFSVATGWSGGAGFANAANVAGSKIVKGLPMRGGGRAPAGLFWALDALIRVSFANSGSVIWQYDTVSTAVSVLAKNAIIEYDGVYFWPGVDRFFMYNGVVQELPNTMSLNFFYDNVNPTHRNKTWAMKIPRFGEIWWLFPRGEATECNHAVIFNVRENTWYDTPIERTAGAPAQTFTRPIMAGGSALGTTLLMLSGIVGAFNAGETITGGTSGAVGIVRRVLSDRLNVEVSSGTFVNAETVTTGTGSATVNGVPATQELNAVWLHETGVNRIFKQDETAIEAAFETPSFQWFSGGPTDGAPAGPDLQTRLVRVEPDFVMTGTMNLTVRGRAFAQSPVRDSELFPFVSETEFISPREQRREMTLRFSSNEVGGDFQAGKITVTTEPGDARG
jgi:hypothetical protein